MSDVTQIPVAPQPEFSPPASEAEVASTDGLDEKADRPEHDVPASDPQATPVPDTCPGTGPGASSERAQRITAPVEYALEYARAGLSVIPVGTDKRPIGSLLPRDIQGKPSWAPYQSKIADETTIRRWWSSRNNIAVVTGQVSGGLSVIDFDDTALYRGWRLAVRSLADRLTIQQTGNGFHAFYRCSAVQTNQKLAWVADESDWSGRQTGIETRGEHGYVLVAPSIHGETGRSYRVIQGSLTNIPVLQPGEAESLLQAAVSLNQRPHTRQELEKTGRHHDRPAYSRSVIDAYNGFVTIEEALEQRGYRIVSNRAIRPGGERDSITIRAGISYHHNTSDPLADGFWHSAFDVLCKLDHGGDFLSALREAATTISLPFEAPEHYDAPAASASAFAASAVKPTDDELGDRWLATVPPTVYGLGDLRRYQDGVWQVLAADTAKSEIAAVLREQKIAGVRPTANLLGSVLELTRVRIVVAREKWDADPDSLVLTNGVLHIPTGKLRSHSREDYATSGLAYAYDPTADAPAWRRFLATTAVRSADFLQEFAGYALTVDTSLEMAVWLHGAPGGGKSTFIDGLSAMLGPKVCNLGLAALERSNFALTNLPGKTLAVSTEQPGDYVRSSHLINALISGEPVTVDRKYRDPIDLIPRVKLVWAMNELPRIADANNGIFRRVKVVNFPTLPEVQRDPLLKLAIKKEGPGILNWALDGLTRLKDRGRFSVPVEVQIATQDFKSDNDIPARFVDDHCLLGLDYKTPAQQLYEAYRSWCLGNGHQPQSSTSVARDWQRLGFIRKSSGGRHFWHGVGLRAG
jgi:P4 family phage/plasmid primase-like protien